MQAKIFFLITALILFSSSPSLAINEVILETDDLITILENKKEEVKQEKTLSEKILDIKTSEITDTSQSHYLLEEILTKNIDSGCIDTVHLFGYYRGGVNMEFYPEDEDLTYDYYSINAGVNGKFKDGKTFYEARFNFNPQHRYSFLQYMPSNIYIANKSIPHHTVIFGNTRTPTGVEGGMGMTTIPFAARSQISRNLANVRKVGLRVKGNYDLIEYDLGGYDSDTYFQDFFSGAEFAGWLNLKPLGKTDGKYGKMKLGGGITTGRNRTDYFVSGLYASYEYKRFMADFEYASANGYNGSRGISSNHAEGFYTTLGYKITPKLQLVGRYDQFTPDKNFSNDIRREYSTGLNWFIKGQALKIMLNYVFCQNDTRKDSHRILLGTQILL